jgi:hypothetical protein
VAKFAVRGGTGVQLAGATDQKPVAHHPERQASPSLGNYLIQLFHVGYCIILLSFVSTPWTLPHALQFSLVFILEDLKRSGLAACRTGQRAEIRSYLGY